MSLADGPTVALLALGLAIVLAVWLKPARTHANRLHDTARLPPTSRPEPALASPAHPATRAPERPPAPGVRISCGYCGCPLIPPPAALRATGFGADAMVRCGECGRGYRVMVRAMLPGVRVR